MKKRILAILISVALIILSVATFASCDAFKKLSEGLEFTSNGNRTCYVSGIGTCTDLDIIIPSKSPAGDTVTSIGSFAFYGCSSLTSIEIPEGVTSIEYDAFDGCSSLTSIEIPASVTSIEGSAFGGCSSLNYNTYGNAKYLGNKSNPYFALIEANYKNITSCVIHPKTNIIATGAFLDCSSLTSIEIPASVTSIGGGAFDGCCFLTSIEIPEGVTNIGSFAFYGCSSLTSIEIPEGVTRIGKGAFEWCSSLTIIEIPDGVTSIGDEAFEWCSFLTSINYNGTKAQWNSISKGSSWNKNTGNYTVYCTDENISKSDS